MLVETKRYKKADSLFSVLYITNSKQLNFLFQQGVIKEKQGDLRAYATYEIVLRKDSLYSNANYKMARYLVQKRQFEEALPYIRRGLMVAPESKRFLILQGLFFSFTDQYYKAVTTFEKLIELGYSNEQIHEKLADNYMEILAFPKAIDQYTILISQYNDRNPQWHYQLGRAHFAIGASEKAIAYINTAISLKDLSLVSEYLLLSSIYKKQKNHKKVFEMLGFALKDAPKSEVLCYQHAIAADNYFKDTKSIMRYYQVYLDRFPNGRFNELAASRLKDLKNKQHIEGEE